MDRSGGPILGANRELELEPCYIGVKELVECESVEEALAILGTHSTFFQFCKC